MLVITRTVGESFRIGDDVGILVANTNGVAVKLGVSAPKEIFVHREEVFKKSAQCMNGFHIVGKERLCEQ